MMLLRWLVAVALAFDRMAAAASADGIALIGLQIFRRGGGIHRLGEAADDIVEYTMIEEIFDLQIGEATLRGDRELRIEIGPGDIYVFEGRTKRELGLLHVGTVAEQQGRQARLEAIVRHLFRERRPFDLTRYTAQQNTEGILGLLDIPFDIG